MPEIKQQRWKSVEYTKRQINDAGNTIRRDDSTEEELDFATTVIDNWRAAHAYPLHVIYIHLRRMTRTRRDILVVERLIYINNEEKVQRFAKLTGEDKTWQFCLNFRQHYQVLLCDFGYTARYSVLDINQSVAL